MTKVMRQPERKPDPIYGPGGATAHDHTRIGEMYEIGIMRFECWCGKIWFETAFTHCGYPEKVARLNRTLGREQHGHAVSGLRSKASTRSRCGTTN